MAMEAANSAAAVHSSQVVGNAFVEQYYHILHQSPELVYKFYQDVSMLSRPDPNGVMTSVTTMQAINEKIQSLDYKNYKAEIKSADAQDSHQEGVIVLVTGCLTGKDNVRKDFTQTFFLAPQEKGYFVLNDIFRYVEDSESVDTLFPSVNSINDSAPPTAPLESDAEPTNVPDHPTFELSPTLEADDAYNTPEVQDPSDNEEGSVTDEEIVDEPPTHSSQVENIAVVGADISAAREEKKSYASIVKVTKVPTITIKYVPVSKAQAAPLDTDQPALGSVKPSPQPEASGPPPDNVPYDSNTYEDVEGHSIYIRNLPLNATAAQLEDEFKKFGTIKRGGVQVRSNKQQGYCFGFVEFESMESMRSAIEASPVMIGNRQAAVEEKRTTTRVDGSGRGRFPTGRGGFRNSFRGRGNFGGGRGYARNDFRSQGEFSNRPKGPPSSGRSVEIYQRVDQNSSGRQNRQSGTNKNAISS